ncbi:MAG: energy transducer TonB [Candidatus Acidiferrales bacterium]
MSFDSRDQANRLFQASDFAHSTIAAVSFFGSEEKKSLKTPEFLVRPESAYAGCLASLKTLCTPAKLLPSNGSKYFNRNASVTGFRVPGAGLVNSFLIHCLIVAGLLYLPYALPTEAPNIATILATHDVIYYPVPTPQVARMLPRIAPRGPGGRPGSGSIPDVPPAPGKTKSQGDLTAISKPLHPDNFHQTIIQPSSPPDVRIPTDQKLPNIALGPVDAPKKPKVSLDLSLKKPTQENARVKFDTTVPVAETNAQYSMVTTLQPTNPQPKLPIPIGALSKPTQENARLNVDLSIPVAETNPQYSTATMLRGTNVQPKMPITVGSLSKPTRRDTENNGAAGSEVPDIGIPGQGKAVLVIGVDPSGMGPQLAVPPGNRAGDFSIAPGPGESGSPGGGRGGSSGGGSGGSGRGGDASVGLGLGREGGGGGKEGVPGTLSIKGAANGTGGNLALDPSLVANRVYPVPWSVNLRKNRMIVSAGPMGGGGLNVYGALACGKIYTIFLPMKDDGWTMQYCQKPGPDVNQQPTPQSTVIQLEAGIVPPEPDMASRYDFQRVSVPPGKQNKLIVLKGTLQEDGNIEGLEVYQGVVPQMDEAARLAFSRWKFRPAMRGGKPVALDILVGIPPQGGSGDQAR